MDYRETYSTEEYEFLSRDVKYDMDKFKDPYVVGAMIHRLVEERKLTNAMFRELNKKLNKLVLLLEKSEAPQFMSKTDEQILELVREKGSVSAEDVQKRFGYRGKNAASARLNALAKQGFLKKTRAGREVLFHI